MSCTSTHIKPARTSVSTTLFISYLQQYVCVLPNQCHHHNCWVMARWKCLVCSYRPAPGKLRMAEFIAKTTNRSKLASLSLFFCNVEILLKWRRLLQNKQKLLHTPIESGTKRSEEYNWPTDYTLDQRLLDTSQSWEKSQNGSGPEPQCWNRMNVWSRRSRNSTLTRKVVLQGPKIDINSHIETSRQFKTSQSRMIFFETGRLNYFISILTGYKLY